LLAELPAGYAAFSPDGRSLAYGWKGRLADGLHGYVTLWEVASRQPRASFPIDESARYNPLVPFGKDAGTLVTTDADVFCEEVQVRDLPDGTVRRTLRQPKKGVMALALSPDGKTLAVGGLDGTVQLWELATGKELASLRGPKALPVYRHAALAFSPDGKTLAVGGGRAGGHPRGEVFGGVQLWDVAGRRLTRSLGGFRRNVDYVAFTTDGQALTAGTSDDTIRTWRLADLKLRSTWWSRVASVNAVAYSPGGDLLVVAASQPIWGTYNSSGELRFLSAAAGRLRYVNKDSRSSYNQVVFSTDGRYLAAVGGSVRVFDVSAFGRLPAPDNHSARGPKRQPKEQPALQKDLNPQDFEGLWKDLAGKDARRAYQAIWKIAAAPDRAVLFLRESLKPAAAGDPGRIARLIRDLDSSGYEVRAKATRELERLGDAAGLALRDAQKGNPSPEFRKRVEQLLRKLDDEPSPERLRAVRAVETLELIGTPEACRLLADLAKGAPEDRLTREARGSLHRLTAAVTAAK
jgi:hypothetical protein